MYLSERYLEMLQNADVEEPKSQQQKNGKNHPLKSRSFLHYIIVVIYCLALFVVFSKIRKSIVNLSSGEFRTQGFKL